MIRPGIARALWGGRLFDGPAWRTFLRTLAADRWIILVYALAAAGQSLLFFPSLYLIRMIFDVAIPSGQVALLAWISLGLFGLRLANSAIQLALRALVLRIIKRAVARLRNDMVHVVHGLSWTFLANSDTDRLHTRIVQDTERVDTMCSALLSNLVPAAFSGLALALILFWLNPLLLLLGACLLPLVWIAGRLTGRLVKRRVHAFQRAFETYSKGMRFVLQHLDLTRLTGHEAGEARRQAGLIDDLRRGGVSMAMGFAVHNQVQSSVVGLAGIAVLVAGGAAVAQQSMTLGDLLAFYVAAGLLNGLIERIGNTLPDLLSGNESLVTLHRLATAVPPLPYHGTRALAFTGHIELRDVAFGYDRHEVMRDVSLVIPPASNIAITGNNGAGKTTILLLIAGFCRPTSGLLLADGVPYDELDLAELRRSIGTVMQRPSLFADTVAANIAYGHPLATRADIVAAARLAKADRFIQELPQGYDTTIGEDGMRLSGGEMQRIAIARALVGRPRLLILDEPTNHIDSATVLELMRDLARHPDGPAIVTISHDASVVRGADTVYRMEGGRLSRIPTEALV